jgi:hypothetical protein
MVLNFGMIDMAKVYGTIKRGKVKIKSLKQLRFLEAHGLSYTSFKRKGGKIIKKRQNA